jgi:hypothetical protein
MGSFTVFDVMQLENNPGPEPLGSTEGKVCTGPGGTAITHQALDGYFDNRKSGNVNVAVTT